VAEMQAARGRGGETADGRAARAEVACGGGQVRDLDESRTELARALQGCPSYAGL
jgi:hypothetical protein